MKFLILLPFVVACASGPTQLSENAKDIEVVTLKPKGCIVVGKVVGHDNDGSREMALNDALNKAAKFKANVLHVNAEVPNGKKMAVHATGYRCE